MKISVDSWHYKLLSQRLGYHPHSGLSLCKYFWMVVAAIPIYLIFIMPGLALLKLREYTRPDRWYAGTFIAVCIFWIIFMGCMVYTDTGKIKDFIIGGLAVGGIFSAICSVGWIFIYREEHGFTFFNKWWGIRYFTQYYEHRVYNQQYKHKEKKADIAIEMLKALKSKTCPLLEFVEEQ